MYKNGIMVTMLLLTIASQSWAAKETTGATFLKIGLGARAVGMGEAFGSVADDSYATYWNPAGLVQVKDKAIAALHHKWLQATLQEFLAYSQPIGSKAALGLSACYLSTDRMEETDSLGVKRGDFEATNMVTTLSWSQYLTKNLCLGLNAKRIDLRMDEEKASSWAGDLGLLYRSGYLRLGLVGQNLGSKVRFIEKGSSLPVNLKAGLSCQTDQLTVALEVNKAKGMELKAHLGAEYWINNLVALRLGYKTNLEKNSTSIQALTSGIGFRIGPIELDYAYVPGSKLGSTHQFSFSTRIRGSVKTIESPPVPPLPPPSMAPLLESEFSEKPIEPSIPPLAPSAPSPTTTSVSKWVEEQQIKEELKPAYGVNFDTAQATLSSDTCQKLDTLVQMLKTHPQVNLMIEGHTDSRPICTPEFPSNQTLSEARANRVANYLINKGIDSSRIKTIGYADNRPIASNTTPQGMAENRRVEIIIVTILPSLRLK